ncbi:sulfite exporter TauE/SafE family protein [Haloechinothrix sp. YIM 98757]|uniref:Probable membrane transporter protein n=1 Tax=Haloechinothrix aidingensis TaxID=2752311 RepID=A0A838A9K0_9PSEU|nr:sulfite exporter TauE/SafE family protein [Haloechinothrix aidingensis]
MTQALLVAGLALFLGAVVQGAAGYGMNLLAAPVLALVDPSLVPVPLLLVSTVHAVLAVAREHRHTDWSGVGWAIAGRVPGVALGVLIVASLAPRPFSVVVGLSVLVCVLLSVTTWHPRPTPRALVLGGVAGGTFGTAATIGGPPIALLYQHENGATIRSTMAVYFVCGSLLSIGGLALGGQVHSDPVLQAGTLLPFMLTGFVLSNPLRRFLDAGWMRPAVLLIATASALALLVRSLVG